MGIDEDLISTAYKEEIIRELEQLQTWKADSDGKLKLKPKEEIKMDIGCLLYTSVLNCWFCPTCYNEWYGCATHSPEDINIENKNFEYYKNLFDL